MAKTTKTKKKRASFTQQESSHRNYKRIGFLTMAIIALFILILASLFLKFKVEEEILIEVNRDIGIISAVNLQNITPEISIKINNNPACTAVCRDTFTDLSGVKKLFESNFTFSGYSEHSPPLFFTLEEFGAGSKLYSYEVICSNRRSDFCPSDQHNYTRRSTLIVNYVPNKEQQSILDNYTEQYETSAEQLAAAKENLNAVNETVFNLSFTNVRDIIAEFNEQENKTEYLEARLSKMKDLWRTSYDKISDFLQGDSPADDTEKLYEQSLTTLQKVRLSIELHNRAALSYNDLTSRLQTINSLARFSDQNASIKAAGLANKTHDVHQKLLTKNFSGYDRLLAEIDMAIIQSEDLKNSYAENYASQKQADYALAAGESMKCIISGKSNCDRFNLTAIEEKEQPAINPNSLIKTADSQCRQASELKEYFADKNSTADEETLLVTYSILSKLSQDLSSGNLSESQFLEELIDEVTSELEALNLTPQPDYYPGQLNVSSTSNLRIIRLIQEPIESFITHCERPELIEIPEQEIGTDNITITTEKSPTVSETLKLKLTCCIYEQCSDCWQKPERNPVILLHGHSFSSSWAASSQTEFLGMLEIRLSDDKQYIPLGFINIYQISNNEREISKFAKPVSVRPTYYLDYYNNDIQLQIAQSKGDSIDTYAIRLKEIIENTKKISGTEKVDIVAHSMGGLVARRYLQVFGENSVGKLIMVGTPNRGIDAGTNRICKLFGEPVECEEMTQGSNFLQKLNSFKPSETKTYTIIGTGCKMLNGEDGDGVVMSSSVPLEYSENFYFKGTCDPLDYMHNKLLNPDDYPAIYDKVKSILLE